MLHLRAYDIRILKEAHSDSEDSEDAWFSSGVIIEFPPCDSCQSATKWLAKRSI